MAIYTQGPVTITNPLLKDVGVDTSSVMSAGFNNPLSSSMTLLGRQHELDVLQNDKNATLYKMFPDLRVNREDQTLSEVMSEEKQQELFNQEEVNLKPKPGLRTDTVHKLIEFKQQENLMNLTRERATTGQAALGYLAEFGGALTDPINIAAGFVPVVGPAKYASMLGRAGSTAGRLGMRAKVGAAEGLVGSALIEPLTYYLAQEQQLDYELSDTFANIMFGTVLGAGLHSGGGLVLDKITGKYKLSDNPLPQEEIMRGATPVQRSAVLQDAMVLAMHDSTFDIPLGQSMNAGVKRRGIPEPVAVATPDPEFTFKVDADTKVINRGIPVEEIVEIAKKNDPVVHQKVADLEKQISTLESKKSTSEIANDADVRQIVDEIDKLQKLKTATKDKRKLARLPRKESVLEQRLDDLGFSSMSKANTAMRLIDNKKTATRKELKRLKQELVEAKKEADKSINKVPKATKGEKRKESVRTSDYTVDVSTAFNSESKLQFDAKSIEEVEQIVKDSKPTMEVEDVESEITELMGEAQVHADRLEEQIDDGSIKQVEGEVVRTDQLADIFGQSVSCTLARMI